MRLVMNRFILIPKPKPEFKMVQPLPAFFEIPTARGNAAGAPAVLAPVLKQNGLTMLPAGAQGESFTAFRKVTS
jgi:hypothetical protein